jgi:quercetin dioxygenase-like cupin family protein
MYEIANFSAHVSYEPAPMLFDPTPANIREEVTEFAEQLKSLPQIELPVQHDFLDGIYMRTVFMEAGAVVVGKIHKQEHVAIISKGSATVLTEHGVVEIKAPFIFKSPPGARRALRIHEDMVWTTVHRSEHTDLALLEEQFIAKDFDDPVLIELEQKARALT